MFKKADKNELRTWFLGSLFIFVIAALVSVIQIGNLIQNEFKFGTLLLAILFIGLAVLFMYFVINCIKAYKTYDERKLAREKQEKEEQEKQALELQEKIKKEQEEMEEIRKREEEKQRINKEEFEAMKKENPNYGGDEDD